MLPRVVVPRYGDNLAQPLQTCQACLDEDGDTLRLMGSNAVRFSWILYPGIPQFFSTFGALSSYLARA